MPCATRPTTSVEGKHSHSKIRSEISRSLLPLKQPKKAQANFLKPQWHRRNYVNLAGTFSEYHAINTQ